MDSPLVSVIIPALNEEYALPRVLQSVKRQEYLNLETIVVDSNSIDNTVKVAEINGADYVISLNERGVSKARNHGFLNSHGDILFFVDSDVILSPAMIVSAVREINRGIIGGTFKSRYSSDTFKASVIGPFVNLLRYSFKIYSQVMFCTREAFGIMHKEYEVFNEKLNAGEDLHFSRVIQKLGPTKFILDKIFYVDTRREEEKGFVQVLKEWRDIYFELKRNNFSDQSVKREYNFGHRKGKK